METWYRKDYAQDVPHKVKHDLAVQFPKQAEKRLGQLRKTISSTQKTHP